VANLERELNHDAASTRNDFWHDRPTFVTGASGFLGGWLVQHLLGLGAHVVCLVRDQVPQSAFVREGLAERVTLVRGDLCDGALLERVLNEHEIVTVLHLAAQAIVGAANRNPVSTFEANIGGTWALLEACRRTSTVKQIVVASSDKAYGAHDTLPYDETAPLQGRHPYDVSKSCADLIAQSYAATYGLPVAITRNGNLFGGGDLNWSRIIPGTIRSALRGEHPVIRSDGQFVRDYFYADDAARTYTLLAQKLASDPQLRGQAFNFSLEQPMTVLDVVHRVLAVVGSDLELDVRNEASHEIREQYLSAARARRELGWQPQHSFAEGLQRTVEWYRKFLQI
jgi:CDP-glucose 4,6-dehydratase